MARDQGRPAPLRRGPAALTRAARRELGAAALALAIVALALLARRSGVLEDARGLLAIALVASAPLVYVLDSRVAACVFLAGSLAWLGLTRAAPGPAVVYWGLIALLAPHLVALRRRADRGGLDEAVGWLAVAAVGAGALFSFEVLVRDVAAVLFPAVFAGAAAVGVRSAGAYYARAARVLGALGCVAATLAFCFLRSWNFAGEVDREPYALDLLGSGALTLAFTAVAAWGALASLRARAWGSLGLAAFPLVAALGVGAVHATGSKSVGVSLLSAYGVALGAATIAVGLRERARWTANAGVALAAAVAAIRLVDAERGSLSWGLVAAGLVTALVLVNAAVSQRQ